MPANPGPPISAIAPVMPILALPSSSRRSGSIAGRYVRYAISNTEPSAASTNATTYSCSMRSVPANAAAGTESTTNARSTSATIISGRRRDRSTSAPAKSPTSSTAVEADATRMPT